MKYPFEKFNLSGKTALITGAAGLLGIEHAAALLQSGATVVLTDIDEARLVIAREQLKSYAASTAQILFKVMNVSLQEEVLATASMLKKEGHRVDVLVNNAAIDPKVKDGGGKELTRLENFSLDQWNLEISVGLTGAYLCGQVFGTSMASDGKGGGNSQYCI